MRKADASRSGHSWPAFLAWSLVGVGYALGLLSIMTIGATRPGRRRRRHGRPAAVALGDARGARPARRSGGAPALRRLPQPERPRADLLEHRRHDRLHRPVEPVAVGRRRPRPPRRQWPDPLPPAAVTSLDAWWPRLQPKTRDWLVANNGDVVPAEVRDEIIAVSGPITADAWWAGTDGPEWPPAVRRRRRLGRDDRQRREPRRVGHRRTRSPRLAGLPQPRTSRSGLATRLLPLAVAGDGQPRLLEPRER